MSTLWVWVGQVRGFVLHLAKLDYEPIPEVCEDENIPKDVPPKDQISSLKLLPNFT